MVSMVASCFGLMANVRVSLAKKALEDVAWRRSVDKATKEVTLSGDPIAVDTIRRVQELALALLDEEEYRATQIVSRGGSTVRPSDAPEDVRGPLAKAEGDAVRALKDWHSIVSLWLVRVIETFDEEVRAVVESETIRAKAVAETGVSVRPLDAPPSALGNLEAFLVALVTEEKARASTGTLRPVENSAGARGPLAAAEKRAADLLDTLLAYESKRLEALRESGLRPMETAPQSPLGIVEGATVGVVRAPILLSALVSRVRQLLIEEEEQQQTNPSSS